MDEFLPGQVRYASVMIPNLRPGQTTMKPRPVILISQNDTGWWKVMGLTTLDHYTDGTPRVPFADRWALGFTEAYLWGRPTMLPPQDIYELHGRLTVRGVNQLLDVVEELSTQDVACLWDSLP